MMYDFLSSSAEGMRIFNEFTEPNKNHPIGDLRFPGADRVPEAAGDRKRVSRPRPLAKYEQSISLYDPRAKGAALGNRAEKEGDRSLGQAFRAAS